MEVAILIVWLLGVWIVILELVTVERSPRRRSAIRLEVVIRIHDGRVRLFVAERVYPNSSLVSIWW